jgi:hypothetical protein
MPSDRLTVQDGRRDYQYMIALILSHRIKMNIFLYDSFWLCLSDFGQRSFFHYHFWRASFSASLQAIFCFSAQKSRAIDFSYQSVSLFLQFFHRFVIYTQKYFLYWFCSFPWKQSSLILWKCCLYTQSVSYKEPSRLDKIQMIIFLRRWYEYVGNG